MLREILIAINILAFLLCGIDKYRAIRGSWRIKEKTFFILSIIGGSVGFYIGMNVFRHKTLHKKFTIGIPFIIILQLLLLYIKKAP